MEYKTSTTTMYLSFTDMTTFFANNLAIHKNKTDQYQMFWSVLLLDNHHHSTVWLKAQMIFKKLLNSLFNSLHMYLSRVKPNTAHIHNLVLILISTLMEWFHMMSGWPYWCPKIMKRQPCWCPTPILLELNSFLMQTLSFVPINLHRCWPREWKHSIKDNTLCQHNNIDSHLMLTYKINK